MQNLNIDPNTIKKFFNIIVVLFKSEPILVGMLLMSTFPKQATEEEFQGILGIVKRRKDDQQYNATMATIEKVLKRLRELNSDPKVEEYSELLLAKVLTQLSIDDKVQS